MTMIDISCSKVFEILAVIDLLKNIRYTEFTQFKDYKIYVFNLTLEYANQFNVKIIFIWCHRNAKNMFSSFLMKTLLYKNVSLLTEASCMIPNPKFTLLKTTSEWKKDAISKIKVKPSYYKIIFNHLKIRIFAYIQTIISTQCRCFSDDGFYVIFAYWFLNFSTFGSRTGLLENRRDLKVSSIGNFLFALKRTSSFQGLFEVI